MAITAAERADDRSQEFLASASVVFFGVWAACNVLVVGAGLYAFNAYSFILLNVCFFCLSTMQGGILYIAAKRSHRRIPRRAYLTS